MTKRPLKPDEKRAWARVAKTVRARPGQPAPSMPALDEIDMPGAGTSANKRKIAPAKTRPNHSSLPATPRRTPPGKPLAPIPNRGRERRIRRGQAAIAATLDLHGYTMDAAQHQLESFLASHLSRGARCVLVITGKGRAGEGVLRRQLLNWLGTSQAKHLVSGYAQAHRKHGGSGAWYIFLRKPDA